MKKGKNRFALEVDDSTYKDTGAGFSIQAWVHDNSREDDSILMNCPNCNADDVVRLKELVRLANKQIRSEARHGKD